MPDLDKIKQVLQYALLAAGQNDDPFERQLGPIHLMKYVYLADMDFAKFNNGETYTGIDWTFHNFGPWSTTVFTMLEESLVPIGAEKRTFSSSYGQDDCTRWKVDYNEEAFKELRTKLPMAVRHAVPNYVGKYRDDTTSLLHFVYATRPMLKAAPGESLDFSVVSRTKEEQGQDFVPYLARISNNKRKRLKEDMKNLREQFQNKLKERRESYPIADTGKTDAIFEAGVEWLDGLSGQKFPESGTPVAFSDEIWKSEFRAGDD